MAIGIDAYGFSHIEALNLPKNLRYIPGVNPFTHRYGVKQVRCESEWFVVEQGLRNKITDISRYSNTQNKVKFADYSSNNSFNTEMERLSRRTIIPNSDNEPIFWFYERVRGQYDKALSPRA